MICARVCVCECVCVSVRGCVCVNELEMTACINEACATAYDTAYYPIILIVR